MAKGKITVIIDDYKYEIYKMGVRQQWKVFTKLTKMIAPAFKSIGSEKNILDVDTKELGKAFNLGEMISALTERFDEDEAYDLILKLIEPVFSVKNENSNNELAVKGNGQLGENVVNIHFSDEDGMFRMLKLVAECIKVNFGGKLLKKFMDSKDNESEPQIESPEES